MTAPRSFVGCYSAVLSVLNASLRQAPNHSNQELTVSTQLSSGARPDTTANDLGTSSSLPRSTHITNYYHESSGGVKVNYDKLVQAADRHRRFISLIVPAENDSVETVGRYGKIYRVAARRAPLFDRRYRMIMPWQYLFSDSSVRKILLAEKPDIIEIYDNSVLTYLAGMTRMGWFKRLGRPLFVYFTGERFDTIFQSFVMSGRFGSWFTRRILANFTLPMFDCYIANSSFVADELRVAYSKEQNPRRWRWFNRKTRQIFRAVDTPLEERLAICPRGVDTDFFSPRRRTVESRARICRAAGIPVTATLVLSATRLSPEKNVRLLPQIMQHLDDDQSRDFRLLIAGGGPEEEFLREEAARFAGKMILIGHLDKASLADHYANADIFIHPNPREPFGNVGLEALASGVACIFPNTGGVRMYASENNAWLVQADAHEFAKAIHDAAVDKELRTRKIASALGTAAQNSQEAAVDRLLTTYDRMYEDFLKKIPRGTPATASTDAMLTGTEVHREA